MTHSFWPPLPCSRQLGRQHNTLALPLGISPRRFGASTEIGHLGAESPVSTLWHRVKTSAGTPYLQLAQGSLGSA